MGYLIDSLHSKLIVLPRISIPVNLTDFNLFNKSSHAKHCVKRYKDI